MNNQIAEIANRARNIAFSCISNTKTVKITQQFGVDFHNDNYYINYNANRFLQDFAIIISTSSAKSGDSMHLLHDVAKVIANNPDINAVFIPELKIVNNYLQSTSDEIADAYKAFF